jgi:hypothetical protein
MGRCLKTNIGHVKLLVKVHVLPNVGGLKKLGGIRAIAEALYNSACAAYER